MYAPQTANIAVVGCSHRTAPVEVRELLFPNAERIEEFFTAARAGRFKTDEAAMVYTCSRVEFYVVSEQPGVAAARIRDWLVGDAAVEASHTFSHTSDDAIHHLLSVCAGVDSIMLGEHEILGQVRDGLEQSRERGTVGKVLDEFIQVALKTGRRARSETDIGKGGTSLAFAAADTARSAVAPSKRGKVVIVGAGQTGALAATHFAEGGWNEIAVLNRTLSRAEEVAERIGGKAYPLEDLRWAVRGAQAVVTAAGGVEPIVTREMVTDRADRPVIMLDLGRPRNIDPRVGEMDGVSLWDLDGLQAVADTYRRKRALEIPKVTPIIEEEARKFRAWLAHRSVVPMVKMLRSSFTGIAEEELSRHQHLFPEEEREKLERFTRSLLNKLLHQPTVQLKQLAEAAPGHEERMDAFQEIFASAGWGTDGAPGDGGVG